MAINGDGFFQVQPAQSFNGNQPVFGAISSYTRRGDFQLDANGYLVNGAGYYLEGIPIDPTTGNPAGNVASPLQFQNNFLPANATTQVDYGINLPTTPKTAAYLAPTPHSELLNSPDFTAGYDPMGAGSAVAIGHHQTNLVKEWRAGGSVSLADTPAPP